MHYRFSRYQVLCYHQHHSGTLLIFFTNIPLTTYFFKIPQLTYSDWVKDKVACSFYEREDKIRTGRYKSSEMWRFVLGYVVSEISKYREDVSFRKNQSKNNGDEHKYISKEKDSHLRWKVSTTKLLSRIIIIDLQNYNL